MICPRKKAGNGKEATLEKELTQAWTVIYLCDINNGSFVRVEEDKVIRVQARSTQQQRAFLCSPQHKPYLQRGFKSSFKHGHYVSPDPDWEAGSTVYVLTRADRWMDNYGRAVKAQIC